jgi:hypothetical protein
MKPNQSIQAITYILSGTLLSFFTNVSEGWSSAILSVFGFIWIFVGYQQLGTSQDSKIVDASKLLKIAAILGIIASLLDLIPLIGMISTVVFILVLVIEIIGLVKLKGSSVIGSTGKSGITLILIGIFFSIISSLSSFMPFIGESVASFIIILSILLTFYGWVKVQSGMIQG